MNQELIVNQESMQAKIIKHTILFSFFVLLAQLVGLVRDLYLARMFGVGEILDVYYMAFKVPDVLNVFYSVFLGSVIFIPLLTKAKAEGGQSSMIKSINKIGSMVLFFILIFSILIFIFMPQLANIIAPEWSASQKELLVSMSRILLIGQFFFPVGILAGTIGLISNKPKYMAMSSFVYNTAILLGALILVPYFGIKGVAVAVVFASILYCLVQIIPKEVRDIYKNFRFEFAITEWKKFIKGNLIRFLAILVFQIYGIVLLYLASLNGAGAVSVFSISYNVFLALFFLFGSSLSLVLMPKMSDMYIVGAKDEQRESLNNSLSYLGVVSIFISFFAYFFSDTIIKILYYFSNIGLDRELFIAQIFGLLMLSFFAYNLSEVVRKYLYSTEKANLAAFFTILILVLVFGFYELLVALGGVDSLSGLAVSFFFGSMASLLVMLIILQIKKELNLAIIFFNTYKMFFIVMFTAVASIFIKFDLGNLFITAISKGVLLLLIIMILVFILNDRLSKSILYNLKNILK